MLKVLTVNLYNENDEGIWIELPKSEDEIWDFMFSKYPNHDIDIIDMKTDIDGLKLGTFETLPGLNEIARKVSEIEKLGMYAMVAEHSSKRKIIVEI